MEEITDEPKSLVAKDSIFRLPSVKASMSFPLSNMDYKKGQIKHQTSTGGERIKQMTDTAATSSISNALIRWRLFKKKDLNDSPAKVEVPPPLVHSVPHYKNGWTSAVIVGSSTYAQLLIVICIVISLSEATTHNVDSHYLEGYFAYLYCVSIAFFLYVYLFLLRKEIRRKISKRRSKQHQEKQMETEAELTNTEDTRRKSLTSLISMRRISSAFGLNSTKFRKTSLSEGKKMKVSKNDHSHVSFFLRAGAVAFGIGTMIYDGLEFAAFLEIPKESPCYFILRGLNPVLHVIFTFLQMYFIFISAKMNIHKFQFIARFGLMHSLATNLCVWIRTLVRESIKEIRHHHSEDIHHAVGGHVDNHHVHDAHQTKFTHHNGTSNGNSLWELTSNISCGSNVLLGDFILDAAPFLYPFLIEFSLIAAAVLHLFWAHVGFNPKYKEENVETEDVDHSIRHLRVDCLGSSRGLFLGLFCLAASLLCMILFFVLSKKPEFRQTGLLIADAAHCSLLVVSLAAIAIGVYQTRHLGFNADHKEELGGMLLRVTAHGIFAYSVFSVTAATLSTNTEESLTLIKAIWLITISEVVIQTLFISDLTRRHVKSIEQNMKKPGRQMVTLLLINNLTLWLVYTFEMQKLEANPVQMEFYGFLPWTIVQRLTLPLCIFYRFHSAVTYAEIWKNTYRFVGPPPGENAI